MKWILIVVTCFTLSQGFAEKLVIGVSSDDPPFSSRAGCEGCFYGFEIDLIETICKRIGAECQLKSVIASQLLDSLFSHKIDLAMSAVISTHERLNIPIQFSMPYFPSSAAFIVKKQSPFQTINDLKDKRIGIRVWGIYRSAMFEYIVLKIFDYHVNIVLYLTMSDLLYALTNDQVDAVFANTEPLKFWQINNSSYFKMLGKPVFVGDGYAVMGKDSDTALLERVNQGLALIQRDGTYKKIYNLYFKSI